MTTMHTSPVRRASIVILVSLTLVGWGKPPINRSLSEKHAAAIESTRLVPVVWQSQIEALVDPTRDFSHATTSLGSGLLWVVAAGAVDDVISANRITTAQRLVQEIRSNLNDFDFPAHFQTQLQQISASNPLFNGAEISPEIDGSLEAITQYASNASEQVVLITLAEYYFVLDFSAVRTKIRTFLIPSETARRSDAPFEIEDAFYRSTIIAETRLWNKSIEKEDNAKKWATKDSAHVRDALIAGINRGVQVLNDDLSLPDYKKLAAEFSEQRRYNEETIEAIGKLKDAKIYRSNKDQTLYVLSEVII